MPPMTTVENVVLPVTVYVPSASLNTAVSWLLFGLATSAVPRSQVNAFVFQSPLPAASERLAPGSQVYVAARLEAAPKAPPPAARAEGRPYPNRKNPLCFSWGGTWEKVV